MKKKIQILGIRGIPAEHGGFETFAEHFAIYLTNKGWDVTVYCQEKGKGSLYEDKWNGIYRIHIPVKRTDAKGTILFDWLSTMYAAKNKGVILTLGYNTAVFCFLYRMKRLKNIINMDGIEWKRDKWTLSERAWLYINEKAGAWLGNHLIADHPEIKKHIAGFVSHRKISVIPYSADMIKSADSGLLDRFGLKVGQYGLVIARPEPENSILGIISAYSGEKRDMPLVVLGNYNFSSNIYHQQVLKAAGNEIQFTGAIYDKAIVKALRFYARFYIHGHTVGGTNPSLVEALGASSPVLAHDNRFNRWVAGKGALYFAKDRDLRKYIHKLIHNDTLILKMKTASRKQYLHLFTSDKIYGAYEKLMENYL